jgi:hypothetical protein
MRYQKIVFYNVVLHLHASVCLQQLRQVRAIYEAQSTLNINVDATHPLIQQFFVELVAGLTKEKDTIRFKHILNYRQIQRAD